MTSYKSSGIAAVLSFFMPGLGHIYDGKILKGFCLLISFFVIIGLVWGGWVDWVTEPNAEVIKWENEISEIKENLRIDRMALTATRDPEMKSSLRELIKAEEDLLVITKINLSWAKEKSERLEQYFPPLITVLILLLIVLWIYGIVNAYKTAERINEIKDREKVISEPKKTNLCADCWFSGDCEKEKKAIKKRKIITDCRGYFPENK